MGSVSMQEDCPRCRTKEALSVECYYKIGLTYGMCTTCGYRCKQDGSKETHLAGFGVYCVATNKGGSKGAFRSARHVPSSVARMTRLAKRRKVNVVEYTKKVRGKWEVITLKRKPQFVAKHRLFASGNFEELF